MVRSALLLLICVCLLPAVEGRPLERGACVIACRPDPTLFQELHLMDCPANQVCRSTGCGYMCYPTHTGTGMASDVQKN